MQDEQTPAPAEQESVDVSQPEVTQEQPAPSPRKSVRESFEAAWAKDLDATEAPVKVEAKAEEKPPEEGDGPARGPDGKFVAKEAEPKAPEAEKAEQPKGDFAEPPSRFSSDAKAAWATAPESVRAEAHRAIREMETGLAQKDEVLKPLEPFVKMAREGGTTLDKALSQYVNLENLLRQDPVRGLTEIARNMGKSPQELAQMLSGEKAEGQPDPRDREIQSLRSEISELKNSFQGVSQTVQQQREHSIAAHISEFAAAHPRFDELSAEMAEMINTGYAKDLRDAYDKADKLNPAQQPTPEPAQAAPQPAPAQTRRPQSLTGAPSPGSDPASSRAPSKSPREALERAFRM